MNQRTLQLSQGQRREDAVVYIDSIFPPVAASIDGRSVASTASSASSIVYCICRTQAKLKQVYRNGPNQGRYFYSCGSSDKCSFFAFADNAAHDESTLHIEWQRFSAVNGWRLVSSKSGYSPAHVKQGGIGDCWFLSAIAVVAERPDLIDNIILTHEDLSDEAPIAFRLFIDGNWEIITIDNNLPVMAGDELKLVYSRPVQSQLWVPFLEKAYAKAHGSYRAISGGWISEALLDLTGAPCEVIDFASEGFDSELTWVRLLSFIDSEFPMGCSTDDSGEGIVGSHAYSILEAKELTGVTIGHQMSLDTFFRKQGQEEILDQSEREYKRKREELLTETGSLRVLRIRNPWSKREFTGDFGSGSKVWTKKLLKTLETGSKNDGTFWMSYHDFLRRFTSVDVCKVHRSGWIGESFSDNIRPNSLACLSTFILTIVDPTWLFLTIIQKTKRGRFITTEDRNYWYSAISFVVLKQDDCENGSIVFDHGLNFDRPGTVIGACFGNSRRCTDPLELHLDPGAYRIVPMCFESSFKTLSSSATYVLRTYSSQAIVVEKLESFPSDSIIVKGSVPNPQLLLRANTASYALVSVVKDAIQRNCKYFQKKKQIIVDTSQSNGIDRSVVDLTKERCTVDSDVSIVALEAKGLVLLVVSNSSETLYGECGLQLTACKYFIDTQFCISKSKDEQFEGSMKITQWTYNLSFSIHPKKYRILATAVSMNDENRARQRFDFQVSSFYAKTSSNLNGTGSNQSCLSATFKSYQL